MRHLPLITQTIKVGTFVHERRHSATQFNESFSCKCRPFGLSNYPAKTTKSLYLPVLSIFYSNSANQILLLHRMIHHSLITIPNSSQLLTYTGQHTNLFYPSETVLRITSGFRKLLGNKK